MGKENKMKNLINIPIDELTEVQAKHLLNRIIDCLDEADEDDIFGTEGWKHFMGLAGK